MFKKMKRAGIFMAALCIIAQLLSVCVAMAEAELPEITVQVRSYDYTEGPGQDWGFSFANYSERHPPEYQNPLDFDYVGITQADVLSLLETPSQWRKYWFRIDISPAWKEMETVEDGRLKRKMMGDQENDPVDDKDMFIRSVKRRYEDEISKLPFLLKAYLVPNSIDVFLEREDTLLAIKEAELRAPDTRQWIMEALVCVEGMSEEEIERRIQEMEVNFDVLLYRNGRVYSQSIVVGFDDVQREVHYPEGGIQISGEAYTPFAPDLTMEQALIYYSQIPEDVLRDAFLHPEQYAWYRLTLHFVKDTASAYFNMHLLPKSASTEDYWIFFEGGDGLDFWGLRGSWKDGEWSNSIMCVLMKVADGETDEEIEERMQNMEFIAKFSTEFAGFFYWSGYDKFGYPGMRFTVDIDMSQIKAGIETDSDD